MKYKMSAGSVIFSILNYTFLIAITIACIYPFYYIIINSISGNDLSARGQILFIPREIHLSNYSQIRNLPGLMRAVFISVSRTVIGTVFTVLASAFLGFLFTKGMWGRKVWYRLLVASMYVNAGLIPYFLVLMRLGFLNNFWVYIIPVIVQPFSVLLVKTFIESTPISLQESAEIDGAGPFKVFLFIILPLAKPILATVAILVAVGQWNEFMHTLLFVTDQRLWTLQFILHQYISNAGRLAAEIRQMGAGATIDYMRLMNMQTPTSVRMTVTVVATLPILVVYPFFQRYFTKGLMMGAVKG